jgi:hypothetical protein
MDPGVQASMPGTEGAREQATSIARSRPKRAAAAAAASSIQQFGAPRQNREATRTTSRKSNEGNDEDPNVTLYNRDGMVWEPRPISKIIQELLNPHQEPLPGTETELVAVPLPPEISVTVQPLTVVVDAASSNSHKKTRSNAPVSSETEAVPLAQATFNKKNNKNEIPVNLDIAETELVPVAETASTNNNKKKQVQKKI